MEKTQLYTLADVFILPFTKRRKYDEDTGQPYYVPLERNLAPTGDKTLDAICLSLTEGRLPLMGCSEALGIPRQYFDMLTQQYLGMPHREFVERYKLRLAEAYFANAALPTHHVCRLVNVSERTLYRLAHRYKGHTPMWHTRHTGDLGRYEL